MIGKRLVRWVGTAGMAVLASCSGCCSFWERHCATQQPAPAYYNSANGCCCPTPSGYQAAPAPVPVAQPGWTQTNGACQPCR